MAITRAQLLKELLPGLNALFGLEYKRYEDESAGLYERENSTDPSRKRSSCPASAPRQ
jgi:hypothetical protein